MTGVAMTSGFYAKLLHRLVHALPPVVREYIEIAI
jgi:hypothetical protein